MKRTRAIWNEFSTKVCTKCNKELPATRDYFHKKLHGLYDLREHCIKCQKEYDNKRYPIIKEHQKAIREIYYSNNRERELERNRIYRKTHKEQIIEYRKKYYKNNKDQCLLWQKEWKKTEKGKQIINFHKKAYIAWRRRIGKILKKDFTLTDWQNCLKYFDNKCAYCGTDENKITIDHLIPIHKFGETVKTNVVPACVNCNSSKNKYDFDDWYVKQPFYDENRKEKIHKFILLGVD